MDRDKNAFFDGLYRRQSPGMFRYARYILNDEHLADVAVQETALAAWKKIDDFLACSDPDSLIFGYLKKIIKSIENERHKMKRFFVSFDDEYTDKISINDEMSVELQFGGIVSDDELSLLKQVYVDGYSYEELAEKLGITKSAVGLRVMRSKEKLRKYMNKL